MTKINLKCIPSYPSEARGLEPAWHILEKAVLHRHLLTLWSLLHSFPFQSAFHGYSMDSSAQISYALHPSLLI